MMACPVTLALRDEVGRELDGHSVLKWQATGSVTDPVSKIREMVQWLGVFTVLAEDPDSAPSTHIRRLTPSFHFRSKGTVLVRVLLL